MEWNGSFLHLFGAYKSKITCYLWRLNLVRISDLLELSQDLIKLNWEMTLSLENSLNYWDSRTKLVSEWQIKSHRKCFPCPSRYNNFLVFRIVFLGIVTAPCCVSGIIACFDEVYNGNTIYFIKTRKLALQKAQLYVKSFFRTKLSIHYV